MTYTVQMWLTVPSTDPAVLIEFRKRWTPTLQKDWATIACTSANLNDLAAELNHRIKIDCAQQIANDIASGDLGAVNSVQAFLSDSWVEGSGGLHSGCKIVRAFPLTGAGKDWSFAVGAGHVNMYVACGFPT